RPEPQPDQLVHLVLHQRDKRGDHQHGAGQDPRRDLERQRLAGARGHDPDAVPAREHGVDDAALPRAEFPVAEDRLEDMLRIHAASDARGGSCHDSGGGANWTAIPNTDYQYLASDKWFALLQRDARFLAPLDRMKTTART